MAIAMQFFACVREPGFVAIDRGNQRAGAREIDGNRAAYAAATAGHHADAASEAEPPRLRRGC